MNRAELKLAAKRRLAENRWPMVLVSLIAAVCQTGVTLTSGIKFNASYTINGVSTVYESAPNRGLQIVSLLFSLFVAQIIVIGASKFFRHNISNNESTGMVLDGFKRNYGKNVLVSFVSAFFVALGMVFFVIPGFVVALGFTLVPYILAENPDLGVMDVLRLSWNLMNGHKWDYFVLVLSFFGWLILDVLTLGILGIFYVHPYMEQTFANYCDQLLRQ